MESWRRHYNTVRPHGSLGYEPPEPGPHAGIRAGGSATPSSDTARASLETVIALTFQPGPAYRSQS